MVVGGLLLSLEAALTSFGVAEGFIAVTVTTTGGVHEVRRAGGGESTMRLRHDAA